MTLVYVQKSFIRIDFVWQGCQAMVQVYPWLMEALLCLLKK